jgi:two-component system, LuxR family, sensor kinase FixL
MTARFNGRRNYTEEMKVRTLDGRMRDVMFLVTFPAPTEVLDTTLIIMLGITDRLEAEARLRKESRFLARQSPGHVGGARRLHRA